MLDTRCAAARLNNMRIALVHALKHSIAPIEASFAPALAGRPSDEFARRQPVGRPGARWPADRGNDRTLPVARTLRGQYRCRRDPFHMLGLRPLHRGRRARARADAGAQAQRSDDRAGRRTGPQDRFALDVRTDTGFDAAGISRAPSRSCRNWRRALSPRWIEAIAPSTIASWRKRHGSCAAAI